MNFPPAKLSDLMDPVELDFEEYVTRFDRQTGQMVSVDRHILSAFEEGHEEDLGDVPEWQEPELEIARAMVEDEGGRFISPPSKFDFNEYRQMERFIGTLESPEAAEQLWRAIKGKGAFRYFKDTAHRLGLLEQWYRYRDTAIKKSAVEWAEANGVAYVDDLQERGL